MSVILDALKKLDREKSFRKSMTANIAVEILRPDLPRLGKRFPHYFATIFLTAMAAAVITYFDNGGLPVEIIASCPCESFCTKSGG